MKFRTNAPSPIHSRSPAASPDSGVQGYGAASDATAQTLSNIISHTKRMVAQRQAIHLAFGSAVEEDVVQRLSGETPERRTARKVELALAVNRLRASDVQDPSAVRVLIFSGREGLIRDLAPVTTNERGGQNPQTPLANIRNDDTNGARSTAAVSRDGEMFKLDEVRDVLARFITDRPGFWNGHSDDLRIEFIGPRGTCEDCHAALSVALAAWQGVINAELGPNVIELTMNTRWTGQQVEYGQRSNSHRQQSTTYGTTDARWIQGPKGDPGYRFLAPHWKNPI